MKPAMYYPVLRAKRGELEGYGHLSPRTQASIRPLFDIPKPKVDIGSGKVDEYLVRIVTSIKEACGTRNPVYIDLSRYDPDKVTHSGALPIVLVFRAAAQLRLPAIPVAGPGIVRGAGDGNRAAVSRIASMWNLGVAYRLPISVFGHPGALSAAIAAVGSELDVPLDQVDLILDLEGLERMPGHLAAEEKLIKFLLTELADADLAAFRAVVLVGTNVPQNVGKEFAKRPYQSERIDMRVWKELISSPDMAELRYGDYGVITPYQTEGSGSGRPPSRIRLATADGVLSYRGLPNESHQPVCQRVCDDGVLYGQADSWGREETIKCAKGLMTGGNASNWVARDTNMHIESTLKHVIDHAGGYGIEAKSSVLEPWEQESLIVSPENV